MFRGIKVAARRAKEHFTFPARTKEYDERTEPFVFRNQDGVIFYLEPHEEIDQKIAVQGFYESRFLSLVDSLIPNEAVALDIGANIGNHALFLSRKCAEVHCFEPNPKALERLRKNVGANHATNIFIHAYGLGDRTEEAVFHANVSGNLGSSKFADGALETGFVEVTLSIRNAKDAVDSLNLKRVDFIKIDVEGMEVRVLEALRHTLEKFRPLVAFEHHEQSAEPGTFNRIRQALPGYRFHEPRNVRMEANPFMKALWHIRNDGKPTLSEITIPERRTYANILAIPSTRGHENTPNP